MPALSTYTDTVRQEWIDYNGHMSEAFYVLLFGYATDHAMEALGMDAEYRNTTGNSLYTVEAHIRYLAESVLGDRITVTTTIADTGMKKLHLAHEMSVGGQEVATEEVLGVHVNIEAGKAVGFDNAVAERITEAAQGAAAPDWVGRSIGS